MKRTMLLGLASGALVLLLTGCGTLDSGRGWGQDAGYPVRWERVKQAAVNAVTDPMTWVPGAGAAVFAIDDFDREVSDWAVDENPIFGSEDTARDMSDHFQDALFAETFLTLTLTPSGEEFKDWTIAKLRGLGVEGAALLATSGATDGLKDLIGRTRPDDSNDNSMPSAHASSSFASASLSNRNLNSIDMNPGLRLGLKAANVGLASAGAWARVEGRKHYPSDVLVGAALGNLLSVFIHDAFMNLPEEGEEEKLSIYVEPTTRGFWAAVSVKF